MRWSFESSLAGLSTVREQKRSISSLEKLIEETKKRQEQLEFENWMMKIYADKHGLFTVPEIVRSNTTPFMRKSFARRSQARGTFTITKVTKELQMKDKAKLAKYAAEELKSDIEEARKTNEKVISNYKYKHIEQSYEQKDIAVMRKKIEKVFQTTTKRTYFNRIRAEDFKEFIQLNEKRLSNLSYLLRGQNQVLQLRISELKAESARKDEQRKSLTANDFAKLQVTHECSANMLKDINSDLTNSKLLLSKARCGMIKARKELKKLLDCQPGLSRARKKNNRLLSAIAHETEGAWNDLEEEFIIRRSLEYHKSNYRCLTMRDLIEYVSSQLMGQKAYSEHLKALLKDGFWHQP